MAKYCKICGTNKQEECVGGINHAFNNPCGSTPQTGTFPLLVDQSSLVEPENERFAAAITYAHVTNYFGN